MSSDSRILGWIAFYGQGFFLVSGFGNTQNSYVWVPGIPREIQQQVLLIEKVTCGLDVHANGLLGAHFANTEKVRGVGNFQCWRPKYGQKLNNSNGTRLAAVWSSSSGSNAFCSLLEKMFPTSWIRRYSPSICPERSIYLTPLDLFLCGFVKEQVYRTSVPDSAKLENRILKGIRTVRQGVLRSIRINLKSWLHAVIQEYGGHMEHQWSSNKTTLAGR